MVYQSSDARFCQVFSHQSSHEPGLIYISSLGNMFGRCRTTWVSAPETVSLHPSQASDGPGQNNSTFLELCKSVTPPCILNPFLFNGHLQTWWTAFCKDDSPIHYKRRIFDSVDAHYPGTFAVDFVVSPPTDKSGEGADDTLPPRTAKFSDDDWEIFVRSQADAQEKRPLLIVLHGLSGGSHEQYIRHVLHPMIKEGWDAFVVNARGCAQHKITTPLLFNARATWDVHQMVDWARETWPNRRLFGIGFSLGANILVNVRGIKCRTFPPSPSLQISSTRRGNMKHQVDVGFILVSWRSWRFLPFRCRSRYIKSMEFRNQQHGIAAHHFWTQDLLSSHG